MKRLINLLLVVVLAVSSLTLLVACDKGGNTPDPVYGFVYELNTDENNEKYYTITSYNVTDAVAEYISQGNFAAIPATDRDLVIPATYKDIAVKEIAPSAFANQLFIRSIVIPASVTEIGSACLAGCTNLESLTVAHVGKKAEGNVNDEKTLGYLFGTTEVSNATGSTVSYNASGSKTYYIPNGLKKITITGDVVPNYALNGFSGVEEVVLAGNVEKIGAHAFENCSSLYNVTLKEATVTIGEYAFAGCKTLASLDLSKVVTIGDYAFNGCTLLGYSANVGTIDLASATSIGKYAFANCNAIESLDLSANATLTLGTCAFSNCAGLEALTLNATITYGSNVFTGCEALESGNVTGYAGGKYVFDWEY